MKPSKDRLIVEADILLSTCRADSSPMLASASRAPAPGFGWDWSEQIFCRAASTESGRGTCCGRDSLLLLLGLFIVHMDLGSYQVEEEEEEEEKKRQVMDCEVSPSVIFIWWRESFKRSHCAVNHVAIAVIKVSSCLLKIFCMPNVIGQGTPGGGLLSWRAVRTTRSPGRSGACFLLAEANRLFLGFLVQTKSKIFSLKCAKLTILPLLLTVKRPITVIKPMATINSFFFFFFFFFFPCALPYIHKFQHISAYSNSNRTYLWKEMNVPSSLSIFADSFSPKTVEESFEIEMDIVHIAHDDWSQHSLSLFFWTCEIWLLKTSLRSKCIELLRK